MSLPRYTEVDRLSSIKMGIERFLIQIHNLYPGMPEMYYRNFYVVFNWTIEELIRLKQYEDEKYQPYIDELIDRLNIHFEGEIIAPTITLHYALSFNDNGAWD